MRPELVTGDSFPHFGKGINKEALVGKEGGKGHGGSPPICRWPFHTILTCPRTQPHVRPCTRTRTLRGTHTHPYIHTPIHVVTDIHTHTHCFLQASRVAQTPADPRSAQMRAVGQGHATPRVSGRAAPGALLRVTALLLRAPGTPQSPRRAEPRSLRLFVMLIPFPAGASCLHNERPEPSPALASQGVGAGQREGGCARALRQGS